MQFLYSSEASSAWLDIRGEEYKYLFRVRRFKVGKLLDFRNFKEAMLYTYKVESIDKKEAKLSLVGSRELENKPTRYLHIIWCIIDNKVIEKTLPMLNQIGVSKISFLYCDRSQKSFKVDLKRLEKILLNSSQQSGRSEMMKVEILSSLDEAIDKYPDFCLLDFGGEKSYEKVKSIMIGCEGGFSKKEKEKLNKHDIVGLNGSFILKSETAAVAFASKILI